MKTRSPVTAPRCIHPAMGDEELEARVARLSCWRGRVAPQLLAGGLSNKNFTVQDGGEKFVVRLGVDVPEHNLLRRTEIQCSRAAAEAGFSPALVHVEPGVLVFRFVEGRTYTPEDVRQDATLARVVALIRRIHDTMPRFIAGPPPLFWVFHAIRDYARGLVAGGSRLARDMARLLALAEELERAVGPVDLKFTHNDLLAANLIDDGKRLWLIDWEYGGFNSPLFDLGNLASNNGLSSDQVDWLLGAYDGAKPGAARKRALAAMTAASLLREAMWSLAQELHSRLPIDYVAYSDDYLGRFARAIDDFHGSRAL
jgi:thiamine kinase-like enzyme